MYPTICPRCGREYTDTEERLSIMLHGACSSCLDEDRWWNEGGAL